VIFSGRRGARFFALAAILALATAAPATGAGPEPDGGEEVAPSGTFHDVGVALGEVGEATLDVVILRPFGAAATAVGFAFFVASLPLVAPNLEIDTSWEVFVMAPVEYTFTRPIGDF
jgi:hypothetical protein